MHTHTHTHTHAQTDVHCTNTAPSLVSICFAVHYQLRNGTGGGPTQSGTQSSAFVVASGGGSTAHAHRPRPSHNPRQNSPQIHDVAAAPPPVPSVRQRRRRTKRIKRRTKASSAKSGALSFCFFSYVPLCVCMHGHAGGNVRASLQHAR